MNENQDSLDSYVAERVTTALREKNVTRAELARSLESLTGYARATLLSSFGYVFNGSLACWLSYLRIYAYPRTRLRKLRTLSFLLRELGIRENDELVQRIKEKYSDFIYPEDDYFLQRTNA